MRFGILGPVLIGARAVDSPKQRLILATLLSRANAPVSVDALTDTLWGEAPPDSARGALRWHIHRLRQLLDDPGRLVRCGDGYMITTIPDELDAEMFEALAGQGRRALTGDEPERASDCLHQALGLWRGRPYEDLGTPIALLERTTRLVELRLGTMELCAESDLRLGRHGEIAEWLPSHVAANPYRERLRAHLMLALYRSGRQVEALECYQRGHRLLGDELGLEPGPELRQLHQDILLGRAPAGWSDEVVRPLAVA